MSATSSVFPKQDQCVYTSQYCEENVWKLCDHVKRHYPEELKTFYVLFISNQEKKIPLWHQKSSKREDRLVIWDYHVVLMHQCEKGTLIYDLDTELPFPCLLDKYITFAIRDDRLLKPDFRRLFRVVPGDVYLNTFASDRSHMLKEDGSWMATPPSYPCIQTQAYQNNLADFISMKENGGVGSVLTPSQLLQIFS
ncbi:hypothetical protein V1264_021650 [Littorina saxatilis]